MTHRLTITVEVDDVDPTLTDPHELAQDILDAYNHVAALNGEPLVAFDSAEWEP